MQKRNDFESKLQAWKGRADNHDLIRVLPGKYRTLHKENSINTCARQPKRVHKLDCIVTQFHSIVRISLKSIYLVYKVAWWTLWFYITASKFIKKKIRPRYLLRTEAYHHAAPKYHCIIRSTGAVGKSLEYCCRNLTILASIALYGVDHIFVCSVSKLLAGNAHFSK